MAQFLRPGSNVTQTSFTNGFAEIDESTASDADFAYGANNTAAVLEVGLSDPSGTPGGGTTTVRYRVAKTNAGTVDGGGNAVTVTAGVYQGGTLIAADSARTVTGTWTGYSWTPSMASVTNWNDLRLRFTTSASGGSPAVRRGGAVSWAELEAPDAVQNLAPPLYSNTGAFYAATIGVGSVGLLPGLLSSSQTFYAATVAAANAYSRIYWADVGLKPLLLNTSTFYGPTVAQQEGALYPSRLDNAQAFYAATVAPGAVGLTPARLDGTATFYAAVVTTGPVALTASRVDGTQNFYGPAITTGAANLAPTLYSNTNSFYTHTVSLGAVNLTATRLDNSSTFYSHTVSPGAVDILPELLTNAQAWYVPTVSVGAADISPPRLDNTSEFYTHVVYADGFQALEPEFFENANQFFGATVARQESGTGGWFDYPDRPPRVEIEDEPEEAEELVVQKKKVVRPKRQIKPSERATAKQWVESIHKTPTIKVPKVQIREDATEFRFDMPLGKRLTESEAIALVLLLSEA